MKKFLLSLALLGIASFISEIIAQTNYITPIVQPDPIQSPSICIVSVTPENRNVVVWEKPTSDFISEFIIYRESTQQTGKWDIIGISDYFDASIFIDSTAEPSKQSYRYKLSALDLCGNETSLSPEHKTMNLSILKGINDSWSLIWDQYVGFTVNSYRIFRGATPNNMQLIGSTTAGNFTYNDFAIPAGDIYYQIEVLPQNICNPSDKKSTTSYSSARSNIVSNISVNEGGNLKKESGLKIYPNPGVTRTKISFPNESLENYQILIYDLAGKIMASETTTNNWIEISLEYYIDGVYIIEVQGPKIYWGKILVNRKN
jgi:hypothetical protein